MSSASDPRVLQPAEPLHAIGLGAAALTLLIGLAANEPKWVNAGISLVILLPTLRPSSRRLNSPSLMVFSSKFDSFISNLPFIFSFSN